MNKKIKIFYDVVGKEVSRLLLFSVVIGLLLFAVEFSFIYAFQGFITALGITTKSQMALPAWYPQEIQYSIALFILCGILRVVMQMSKTFLSNITSQAFARYHRAQIFDHSLAFNQKTTSHEMVSLFTDTLNRACTSVMELNVIFVTVTSTFLLMISGFRIAPGEMLIGISLMALLLFPLRFSTTIVKKSGDQINEEWKSINKLMLEGMKHNIFIKIHGLLDHYVQKGKNHLLEYEKHYRSFFIFSAIRNGLPTIFGLLIVSVLSYYSVINFKTSEGALISFLYIFIRCAQGGSELQASLNSFKLNVTGIFELDLFKKQRKALINNEETKRIQLPSVNIEQLKNIKVTSLDFSYENDPILSDINFELNKGDVLLIQGESGTGKSTLISLLLGLNYPSSGSILYNQNSLQTINPEVKNIISYAGPEPYIFEDSIRNNLLLGLNKKEEIDDKAIFDSLDISQLGDFVRNLPGKLDYSLNEYTQLSTGQKQRLSFARAILRAPQLLILDEATANIDAKTEKAMIDNLSKLLPKMITIIVSHKPGFELIASSTLALEKQK